MLWPISETTGRCDEGDMTNETRRLALALTGTRRCGQAKVERPRLVRGVPLVETNSQRVDQGAFTRSTRRFFARPASSSLPATGASGPTP